MQSLYFFLRALMLTLLLSGAAGAQTISTPLVLYTDIVSGPNSGGENGKGIYLSIFGKNFGAGGLGSTVKVYINNVEVDNYRYLGTSKGRPDIQQITVQVGALGNPPPGVALPIKVVVNGAASNVDQTFMVNPGRILFVDNVSGNDSTAVIGDISKPYRYVQTPALYTGGAWAQVAPGDFIVMRGHGSANPWTDVGFEGYFMRYRNKSGSAPTGAAGTGAIAIIGYPGEDAYVRGTLAKGMTGGCISAINGQNYVGMGQWAVVANLRMDCEGYDGPISQEIFGHNWRVINNDLAASTAPTSGSSIPRMAGITGNGNNAVWYGNHIHDIQGSSGECHGIYIDGDGSYDIAYNNIHDIRSGNGFQVYVNGGNGTDEANNINLHHNLIHDVSKHGINIGDGMHNNLNVWNNVVYNVQYAALRFNTNIISNARIVNNTFYNTNLAKHPLYGAITNDWNLPNGSLTIENNIFYVVSGTPYNSGSNGVPASTGTISRNLWFNGVGSTSVDSSPVLANPQFVNAAGADFHLQSSSPAVGVGVSAISSLIVNDYDATTLRPTAIDLGALQRVATGSTTVPDAPTALSAVAGNGQATVSFTAPTNNGGSAITGYTVTSNPAGGVDSNAGSTGLSHVITGLTNGTAYTFTVVASNAVGTSSASTASNSVTPSAPVATVPGAPTAVSAVAGNGQATVSFTAPTNNGGSAITGYTVTSSPAGGVDSNAGSTGLSHVITGLTNGTAYTFTVVASNTVGTSSASTASNSVTPTAPVATTITVSAGSSVTLTGTTPVIVEPGGKLVVTSPASVAGVSISFSGSGSAPVTLTIGSNILSLTPSAGTRLTLVLSGNTVVPQLTAGTLTLTGTNGQPVLAVGSSKTILFGVNNPQITATLQSNGGVQVSIASGSLTLPATTNNPDGALYAGETATFDKTGKLTRIRIAGSPGNTAGSPSSVNLTGVTAPTFPRLDGSAARWPGQNLLAALAAALNSAFQAPVSGGTQSALGTISLNLAGIPVTFAPIDELTFDASLKSGLTQRPDGSLELVSAGVRVVLAPMVAELDRLVSAFPNSTLQVGNSGVTKLAIGGKTYSFRAAWVLQPLKQSSSAGDPYRLGSDGRVVLRLQSGQEQTMNPALADTDRMLAVLRKLDAQATLTIDSEARIVVTFNQQTLRLQPDYELISAPANNLDYWVDSGKVYVRYADGTAQGLVVLP